MYDFFLSYSRDSYEGVTKLILSSLENLGFNIWIDRFDVNLGVDIYQNIKNIMDSAKSWKGAIVVFDSSYFEKKWCLWELDMLIEREISIYPVLWNIKKSDFPKKYKTILEKNYGKTIIDTADLDSILTSIMFLFISDWNFLPSLAEDNKLLHDIINNILRVTEPFKKMMLLSILIEYLINKTMGDPSATHWLEICNKYIGTIKNDYFIDNCFKVSSIKFFDVLTHSILKKYWENPECNQ